MRKLLPLLAILPLLLAGCLFGGGSSASGNSASNGPNNSIAVLGDSYSAGEGTAGTDGQKYIPSTDIGNFAGTGAKNNPLNLPGGDACHRSTLSYAVKIFNAGIFVACSGASSGDMDGLTGPNGMSYRSDTSVSQVNRLRLPPTAKGKPNDNLKTVIISVGGDDMGFAGVLTACSATFPVAPFIGSGVAPGVCQTAINETEAGGKPGNYSAGFAKLHDHLVTLYGDIHSAAPDAHIYTVGYPHIFPQSGFSGCNGIAPRDQIELNTAENKLNAVIHTAASDYVDSKPNAGQVTFVDTTDVMDNHWVCGNPSGSAAWINDLQLATTGKVGPVNIGPGHGNCAYKNVAEWVTEGLPGVGDLGVCSQSYHPNALGAKALGKKVQACITNAANCEPNPPPNAIAAWDATFGGCASTMGASLRGVADLLPRSDTTQIADLNQFAGLPLAELGEGSQSQQTEGQADLAALNKFFGTNRQLTTFTGPCQSTTPTPPVPGNDSPADAVDGFYQNELAGDWLAVPPPFPSALHGVCSYVIPSAQDLCDAGTVGQGPATGRVTVGQAVVSGDEALVPVTGNICAPSSPCVSNADPTTGMPLGPSEFAADYQAAVANSTGSTTVLSPMPVSEVNGQWYVDFGQSEDPSQEQSQPPPATTQPSPPPSSPSSTPSSTPSSPSSTPTNPPATALAAWQATANDPAATLDTAYMQVASDLPSSDATQIAELKQLASLPPTGDTPAQVAEGQADVTALDKFFNTPGFQPNL